MTKKQHFIISIAVFLLVSLFFFILYSKKERDVLVEKNEQLTRENLSLSVEIDRLENDLKYIENIARQELGMIAEDELILKPSKTPDP
jgi:cell division protein FtsB